jgi:hypothetical protein
MQEKKATNCRYARLFAGKKRRVYTAFPAICDLWQIRNFFRFLLDFFFIEGCCEKFSGCHPQAHIPL